MLGIGLYKWKWRIVDTSYDSQLKAGGYSISKYKSSKEYFKSKQY